MSEIDAFELWRTLDEIHADITPFDQRYFLANPIRGEKLGEFLSYISEFGELRVKLMIAVKDSWFWEIADAFQNVHSKNHAEFWEKMLPRAINDFLDELERNEENNFSRNEIYEITTALYSTFGINNRVTFLRERVQAVLSNLRL